MKNKDSYIINIECCKCGYIKQLPVFEHVKEMIKININFRFLMFCTNCFKECRFKPIKPCRFKPIKPVKFKNEKK